MAQCVTASWPTMGLAPRTHFPRSGDSLRQHNVSQRVPVVLSGAADCKNDSSLVRRFCGGLVYLPGVLSDRFTCRICLCARPHALFVCRGANVDAPCAAARIARVAAHRTGIAVASWRAGASTSAHFKNARGYHRRAVRRALGQHAAAAGLAGASRLRDSISVLCPVELCLARGPARVSVVDRTATRHARSKRFVVGGLCVVCSFVRVCGMANPNAAAARRRT